MITEVQLFRVPVEWWWDAGASPSSAPPAPSETPSYRRRVSRVDQWHECLEVIQLLWIWCVYVSQKVKTNILPMELYKMMMRFVVQVSLFSIRKETQGLRRCEPFWECSIGHEGTGWRSSARRTANHFVRSRGRSEWREEIRLRFDSIWWTRKASEVLFIELLKFGRAARNNHLRFTLLT